MDYPANQFVDDLNLFLGNDTSNHKYECALHKGIKSENINFCKTLLNDAFIKDIDYQYNDLTPLMLASQFAYPELVEKIIKMGATIDKVSPDGNTALYLAISCGNYDNINILINNGANINVCDPLSKNTPLIYAINKKTTSIIKLLIDKGSHINAENLHGNTALIMAATWDTPEHLEILIENGADIYHKNHGGYTALDLAKLYHIYHKNHGGCTDLDLAKLHQYTENIKILEEADKKKYNTI